MRPEESNRRYQAFVTAALSLLLCFTSPTLAEQEQVAPDTTIRVSTQLVVFDVTVTDTLTGQSIAGLSREDFSLREDGIVQSIRYLNEDSFPLSIVFMFDVTATVRPTLKSLAAGARHLLEHLGPQDEAAVMVFSSHATLLQDFTTNHGLIEGAVLQASNIVDRDATFINEDVFEATEQANRATIPEGRRVEFWFTDGSANYETKWMKKSYGKQAPAYLHTRAEVLDALDRSGVVIGALIERSAMTSSPFMFLNRRTGDIQRLAEHTGGFVATAGSPEVADRFAAMIDGLHQRYIVGYKPSVSKAPGTLCHITVTLSPAFFKKHPGLSRSDTSISARQSYYR